MIKSTRNGYCDHVQSIKNLSACVENSGELGWVVGCSVGGERWDGTEEEGETEEESVGRGCVYNDFYRWNHRRNVSVSDSIGDSVGDSAMSLYGYLGLNSSVIPSIKSSEKTPRHHTVASFQTNCIGRRRSGWYIPTVSPTELCHRYIPTDFETELFPSVRITDKKIPSVILLVFADFLVAFRGKSILKNNH